jgi:hypothetical protein
MAKVKTKKIKLMGDDNDSDLTDLFSAFLGISDPDPQIVIPKYKKVHEKASSMLKLFESLLRTSRPFYQSFFELNKQGFMDIRTFVSQSATELDLYKLDEVGGHVLSAQELTEINANPEKLREYLANANARSKIDGLHEKWKGLKDCSTIQNYILIARNIKGLLIAEKSRSKSAINNLEDKSKLSLDFIRNSDGDYLRLFEFSSLNFKQILLSDVMTPELEQYLALFLHLLYKDTLAIVETISMPDIDVNVFSDILISRISDCKKQVPRCDMAFKKIADSVHMLKDNFPSYYKDFVTSRSNPGIIIENFIMDVSTQCEHSPELMRQFRSIMAFIQQNMNSSKTKNPNVDKIFMTLGRNMDLIDKKAV